MPETQANYMLHKATDKIVFFSEKEMRAILNAVEEVYSERIACYDERKAQFEI
jgi:hypothetical protein